MALNIKNAEVESLAVEVAKLAHESKTEAIRIALKERAFRLKSYRGKLTRRERIEAAVVAIVLKEAGYQDLLAKIESAPGVAIGAPN